MPATHAKPNTKSSNAGKHPGALDQKKKCKSLAEMAAIKATEKACWDVKAEAKHSAPLIIAAVKDNMAIPDKDDDKNATRPLPVDIKQVFHHQPICPIGHQVSTFAKLVQDGGSEEVEDDGSSEESAIEEFGGSNYFQSTSLLEEPLPDAKHFKEPVKKVKKVPLVTISLFFDSNDKSSIKKSKSANPSSLIKGFVPSAMTSCAASVTTPSSQKITEWCGLFGAAAVIALETIFCSKGIKTVKGHKKYAQYMLSKGCPYTYLTFNSAKMKGSGLFQSELILSTFVAHFTTTNMLKDEFRSTDNP
ncbi:hypothetical protein BJV74DRAFT_885674 [Russula compacta]|nr:hypothetical protein BJV74DRAFT_885674 [Russula compacta]